MKVVNLVSQPQWRGAEIFALDFRNSLVTGGHESVNIYLYEAGITNTFPLLPGDIALGFSSTHPLERIIGFNPVLLLRLSRALSAIDPDVIQLHGDRTNKYAALLKLFRLTRAVIVARIIGDPSVWLKGGLRIGLARALYKFMDGFIAVTNLSKDNFVKLINPRPEVRVIMNGIDLEKLEKGRGQSRSKSGFTLLFVGTLDKNKRADIFIEILAKMNRGSQQPVFGWVVGDGPERHTLEGLAARKDLRDRITFFGYSDQMRSFYENADVLVMTSESEGLPAAVLEASHFGRPVIANRVGGLPECVMHNETGFLVKGNDVEQFVAVILRIQRENGLKEKLGAAGKEMVKNRFEIGIISKECLTYYNSLPGQHGN